MKRLQGILVLLVVLVSTAPSQAQLIFSKKPKANPSQRVPELILTLKTDKDDKKRASAAEELRDYDSVTFAEIVPVLVDVLKNDKKPNVRLEALNSLARIRPVSTLAGQAIEKAAADDDTWRVRWQAKGALTKYQLAGYASKKIEPKGKSTDEPPLAEPKGKSAGEPPLAEPKGKSAGEPPLSGSNVPLPLPRFDPLETPRVTPAAPAPKSEPAPAPKSAPMQQGPSLFP
jgi:hypothetical protein